MHTTKLLIAIAALSSVGLASAASKGGRIKKKLRTRKHNENVMDEEDAVFWTRLLEDERGQGTDVMSLPPIPRPPSAPNSGDTGQGPPNRTSRPTPDPTRRPTPNPTRRPNPSPVPDPTPDPTRRPTPNPTRRPIAPPAPTPPAFICPDPNFVGCTAPDPTDFENECPTVGGPCDTPGEFCCRDACPRNFCTAKQGSPP